MYTPPPFQTENKDKQQHAKWCLQHSLTEFEGYWATHYITMMMPAFAHMNILNLKKTLGCMSYVHRGLHNSQFFHSPFSESDCPKTNIRSLNFVVPSHSTNFLPLTIVDLAILVTISDSVYVHHLGQVQKNSV